MKNIAIFLFVILFNSITLAQQNILSDKAEVSVLTVGPGTDLNDAFGHSAFRIKDPSTRLDVVYGYGEYDFDAPNFYLKFAQGKLNYLMSKDSFYRFYQVYIYYNRTVREQVLNLSLQEKQNVYNYLIENYKPKNRKYLYDFFFDNCATRIKDVSQIALNNKITFNTPETYQLSSFRTLIQENLNRNTWGSLGVDLALGSVIDKNATAEEHMFLPKNIYSFFAEATLNDGKTPLVKSSRVILTQKPVKSSDMFFSSPLFIFGLIALGILFITFKDFKNRKQSKWLDTTLFAFTGLIGVVILLLWFATDHKGTHQNYNLLWAFALNLITIGQLFKQKVKLWFIKYLKLLLILLCLLTLHWIIGIQVFAIGFIPLLLALFIRYLYLIKYYKSII